MTPPQIIGIMLVKNEDRFLRRAVTNILEFCDRILIADHQSTDGTFEIAQELSRTSAKVEPHRIRDPRESSEMLTPFVNTHTWVFGIDGDEIYDISGLAEIRSGLASGLWREWWVVFGNVLNCDTIDEQQRTASGWLAPPCRSMTKLYNFAAVQRLDPDSPQRLMGRENLFNPGYDKSLRHELYKTLSWEEARFRCLHACFLPRSSRQSPAQSGRENITELRKYSPTAMLRRLAARLTGRAAESQWKHEKYRRGEYVTVDAAPFFP
jgi:hypothetical protein